MKIVLASNNKDKLREIREILSGSSIEILSQREAGCHVEPEETGTTFEENARIKARAAMEATGLPAVADDSGLCVDAMGGGPGVYSSRYCGELSYPETCQRIIKEISGDPDKSARFVCAVVCCFPDGRELTARGVVEGSIGDHIEGENGFGYDIVFVPEGYSCTMACLTDGEKNAISHRGKAFREFAEKLQKVVANDAVKE